MDAVHHQAFASSELEAAAQQVSLLGGHTRRVQTLVSCHNGTVGPGRMWGGSINGGIPNGWF